MHFKSMYKLTDGAWQQNGIGVEEQDIGRVEVRKKLVDRGRETDITLIHQ